MPLNGLNSIFDDLEAALQDGEHTRRVEMLRRVTNLFLDRAAALDADQVNVFGDVLSHLTRQVEKKVLAELGAKLSPVANAPNSIIQSLARHDEIEVAGPVLSNAQGLTESDLIDIARTKGQGHLGAISGRAQLTPGITDVIVERGDEAVVTKLAGNSGAAFSEGGFQALARRAETNEELAVNLGGRVDVPPAVLKELVAKATDAVRARLKSRIPVGVDLQNALDAASMQVLCEASQPRSFRRAEALVGELMAKNQLTQESIVGFAKAGHVEDMVVGVARLCAAPIDMINQLTQNPTYQGLLVACKAAAFEWPTVEAILMARLPRQRPDAAEIAEANAEYVKLTAATAQRVFRFWLVRGVAGR